MDKKFFLFIIQQKLLIVSIILGRLSLGMNQLLS